MDDPVVDDPVVDDPASDVSGSRRGRRPAGRETRGEILVAARAVFLEQGYDATSMRAVARRAGVDPGTVRHWFGDKARLFVAAIGLSDVEPGSVVRAGVDGPLDGIGTRLVRHVLEVWDADDGGAGIRLALPVALADPAKRALLPQFLGTEVLGPIAARLDPATAQLRAALAATQMVGVLLARYVVGVEPVASLPAAQVAELVGPTLERYLVGSLDGVTSPGVTSPGVTSPGVTSLDAIKPGANEPGAIKPGATHPGEPLAPPPAPEQNSSHGE